MEARPYRTGEGRMHGCRPHRTWSGDTADGIESMESCIVDLRSQAVDLVTELEDMTLRQGPIIKSEYQVKIGCWQIELLRARLDLKIQKRRCEIVQQSLEECGTVDLAGCLDQVLDETQDMQSELATSIDGYLGALEYRSTLHEMSDDELDHVRSLFRKLVARFHPHLHPDDGWSSRIFSVARNAYRGGDAEVLGSIEVATRSFPAYDEEPADGLSEDELEIELVARDAQVTVLETLVKALGKAKPHSYRTLLEDQRQVEREVDAIRTQIDACEDTARTYSRHLQTMLERNGYGEHLG